MGIGRTLILAGAALIVIGLLVTFGDKLPIRLGRLPGDIEIRGKNSVFYFPVVTCILPDGEGYAVTVGEPWPDFPSDDVEADTRRMNAWIETAVRAMPEQYYWVHRRFKTRPPGEPRPY